MTEDKLLAAIKDLDAQMDEFLSEHDLPCNYCHRQGCKGLCMQNAYISNQEQGWTAQYNGVSVSNQDGQAGGVRSAYSAPAPAERGESHSSDSPRTQNSCGGLHAEGRIGNNAAPRPAPDLLARREPISSAGIKFAEPERVYPTRWLGWLLVGAFLYCAGVLVWAWVRR